MGPFKGGDAFYLLNEVTDDVVGEGIVVSVLPTFTVHTVQLGSDCVAVRLDKVIDRWYLLSVPDMDAETVGQLEIGSNVRWPAEMLLLTIPETDDAFSLPNIEDSPVEVRVQCSQTPRISPVSVVDLKQRQNWNLLEVYTVLKLNDGTKIPVAEGLVTLTTSSSCVNNTELGELNVGVAVTKISDGISMEDLSNSPLAGFLSGPMLVSWPINSVVAKTLGRSLYSLQQGIDGEIESEVPLSSSDEEEDSDFILDGISPCIPQDISTVQEPPVKKRRHYNSAVRNAADPLQRARREAKRRAQRETTEDKIKDVQKSRCRGEVCIRKVLSGVIRQCRQDYFGLPHDEREEFLHTRLHMRHQAAIEQGMHIIDQKLICKRAFWTIYGFSRTKYYEMIKQAGKGIVRGYHGNKGRRKPRPNSCDGKALLGQILAQLAEPMPHMQHNFSEGEIGIVHMLPFCYSRESIMKEVNSKMASIGNVKVSKTLFYALWTSNFSNYKFHKRGAFAKCDTCVTLKHKLMQERRPDYRRPIEELRDKHMSEQMSRRNVYYSKRTLARAQPDKYLCLIHDKMDQAKTNIPRLAENMKKLHIGGCLPLPVSLTGMLTHGREPGAFCHLSLTGIWPGDPNFTVTSLAKCLRDLEQNTIDSDHAGDLSRTSSRTPLFRSLLDQTAFRATMGNEGAVDSTYIRQYGCEDRLQVPAGQTDTTFKKLPPTFMLQMDNSAKDNKNIHVLAFCSELVIRGVFETVEVNFLMVGHTHEDVDALFSKVSARTVNKDVLTLPALMAEIWESESMHHVPMLMEEVADYKTYVNTYLKPLIGQSQPLAFRFSMADNVPIYRAQWKVDRPWLPEGGNSLWKMVDGKFTLPTGEPKALKLQTTHPRLAEVSPFIDNLVNFLQDTYNDETSEGFRKYSPVISYWKTVQLTRIETIEDEALQTMFWPQTDHGIGFKLDYENREATGVDNNDSVTLMDELDKELDEENAVQLQPYIGVPSQRPKRAFVPLEDISEGRFVVLRPDDAFEAEVPRAVWLGRCMGSVVRDTSDEHHGEFLVEWWRPRHRKSINATNRERYSELLVGQKEWEKDPGYNRPHWINASAAIYSWKYRSKNEVPSTTRLNPLAKEAVKCHLERLADETIP
ncbi:hypothetical protein R1sor_018196 [Riccia sorocarpa]|uniref:DUF7869 domain-containing protein n=1 Tax=Riccia sorocarpa TaxID=122646 RepID=A0ABD3IF72_9MARC